MVLWWTEGVEIAGAVTSENLHLGWQILDREAMGGQIQQKRYCRVLGDEQKEDF